VNGVTIIAHGSSSPKAIKNAIRVAAEAAKKNLSAQIAGGLQSVPGEEELPGGLKRRGAGFWQNLKGRFRRDGKADRNGDAGGEAEKETGATEEVQKPE